MRHFYTFTIAMLLMLSGITNQVNGQISIPYGDDGILIPDSSENDFRYDADGRYWDCRNITYYFINGTDDIPRNEEEDAVRRAFQSWSEVTNLDFLEACKETDADIRIMWAEGSHGDPCPKKECDFDGPGGILAHAFFPPPNAGDHSGDIHFDDAETWTLNGSNFDLETVALHEIGHAIGLRHSIVQNSVMEAYYSGKRRNLTNDDIQGIQSIYGQREDPIVGSEFICDSQEYYVDYLFCSNTNIAIIWTVSSNLTIVRGQGTYNVTIEKNKNVIGSSGKITVKLESICGYLEYSKTVLFGPPKSPDITLQIDPCFNLIQVEDLNYNPQFPANYTFIISITSRGRKTLYQKFGHPLNLHLPFNPGDFVCVENVMITNDCGSTFSDIPVCEVVPECDGDPNRYLIKASPNPVVDMIHIEILDSNSTEDIYGHYTLFNKLGDAISTFPSDGMITYYTMNNENLTNDILFLVYTAEDGYSNTEKLIIVKY